MNSAKSAGLVIKNKATNNLDILCYGEKAAPVKIQKEQNQNIAIVSVLQFKKMLDTKNLPSKKRIIGYHDEGLSVCFTGFDKVEKCQLINLAKDANMFVTNDVISSLFILCCGENAGPVKLQFAREHNVAIVNSEQFKKMLITGELP